MLTQTHARARQKCVTATDHYRLIGEGYGDEKNDCGLAAQNIFAEKLAVEPIVREPNERMRAGTALEPEILARYVEATGNGLLRPPPVVFHDEAPIGASLDMLALGRVVEAKAIFGTPGEQWGEEGTDQIPERIIVQTQIQMLVTGLRVADVPVWFVPYCFRVYRVEYDPALANLLVQIAKAFWRFVEERECPPSDWKHPFAATVVAAVQRIDPLKTVQLTDTEGILAQEYADLRQVAKEAEERADDVKQQIIAAMGEAACGKLPGGGTVRRSPVHRKAYTVAASEYQQFRVYQPKKVKAPSQ